MPRMPDVTDYGRRPSLRSNRVDVPDQSGLMMAEALVSAESAFVGMLKERKGKRDRLNYALAKNELLQADITERQKLRDDEDWATYDERYTEGFNGRRDEIIGKYIRDPSDQALFAAESDLMRERGRINVADASRRVEIDEKATTLDAQIIRGRELILIADPATANDQMLSLLDSIKAAEAEGILTDAQALEKSQKLTTNLATGRLVNMEPELRQQELEKSLAARSATGVITDEDIREGRGTGSIADFLPADVAKKMLETTKKENDLNAEYEFAINLRDQADAMFPEDSQAMMKYIREQSKGQEAKTRARAEQFGRQLAEERRVIAREERDDIMVAAGELLNQADEAGNFLYGIEDLPRDDLAKLSPGQRAQLEAYHNQLRNRRQFAEFTNWHREERDGNGDVVKPAYSTWTSMSPEEKSAADLTNPMWHTNFEQGVWKQMADEQEKIRGGNLKEKSIQTLDQIMTDVWAGELGLPRTGRSDDEDRMYYMMRSEFASRIDQESDMKYGGQSVPDDRRKEIAREVMARGVWERDQGLAGIFGRDSKEPVPVATVDPDNFRDYYVPIDNWRNLTTTVLIGQNREPVQITWEKYLTNMAQNELDGRVPNQKDLENAYAQIIIGGEPELVIQRVMAALRGEYEY